MKENFIKIERTARYFTLGELNENTKTVWFAMHGYGQLAQYFIKKFDQVVDSQTFIVAPEAVSRFYLDESYNRVGATWMTKEMRQEEMIENNLFLNQVYDTVLNGVDLSKIEINLLGFSQGCATACRWIDNDYIKCKRLVLWAGFFNNGFGEVIDPVKLKNIETYYAFGKKDEYFIKYPEITTKFKETMIREVNPKIFSFDGGHTIDEKTLKMIIESWSK